MTDRFEQMRKEDDERKIQPLTLRRLKEIIDICAENDKLLLDMQGYLHTVTSKGAEIYGPEEFQEYEKTTTSLGYYAYFTIPFYVKQEKDKC